MLTRRADRVAFSAQVLVADNLRLPLRPGCFDRVLSIAVIHHFSSHRRRVRAMASLLQLLRPSGRLLVTVWAKEQPRFAAIEAQDVLVPWHLRCDQSVRMPESAPASDPPAASALPAAGVEAPVVYQRFYRLFAKGELERLVDDAAAAVAAPAAIVASGFDRDNWYVNVQRL